MIGRVVSTKMNDTATVLIERVAKHSLYKKTYVRSKKYLADTTVAVKDGDMVEIVKIRPVSKNKHWKVIKVVGKDLEAITEEKLKAAAEETIAEVMPSSDAAYSAEAAAKAGKAMEDKGKEELKAKEETLVNKKQKTKSKKEKK